MPKVIKTYPAPYGGESEQVDELLLDTQCRDMINCVPDIVLGIQRRNGFNFVSEHESGLSNNTFHTYERGEGDENYRFIQTGESTNPLRVFTKEGIEKTVSYADSVSTIYDYMDGELTALTVQDRTFIANKDKIITQATLSSPTTDYRHIAYYWLKRSSNDDNNPYRYAVYLNGVTYNIEGSDSDTSATQLASKINSTATNFTAVAIGSIMKITYSLGDFNFSSWDSWGNQASFGWKGYVAKLSDLPSEMPWNNVVVEITGNDTSDYTDYFVKSSSKKWIESRDPYDLRGELQNMPIYVDRLSDETFEVGLLTWEEPHVGNILTNATPSFVGNTIQDIFFFKNRLGFASGDSLIMSEEGGYYNFFIKTALKVIDTDPIDISSPSVQASKIYFVSPFQKSLYLFTKTSQFEVVYQGTFSPLTVSIDLVSTYDMDINVEPKPSGNSLFFISRTSANKSQLREYLKNEDSLVINGIDLTLNRPTLLPHISKILTATSLGIVIMFSTETPNYIYFYKSVTSGNERIQSALYKWKVPVNIIDISLFDKELFIFYEGDSTSIVLSTSLFVVNEGDRVDIIDSSLTQEEFESSITLAKVYPKITDVRTPLDKIQLTRLSIFGDGIFNVNIFRESYNSNTLRTYLSGSTKDNSASIAGRSNDTILSIKNGDINNFIITSFTIEGMYNQHSRRIK